MPDLRFDRRRRLASLALAALALATGGSTPLTAQPARPRLLIAGFEAAPTCDPRDTWIAIAVEETLAWRMRRAGACALIPVVRAYQARTELSVGAAAAPAWPDVARALGATALITGTAVGPPESVTLTLTCTPLNGRTEPATFSPPPARLFDALNVSVRWVVDITGDAAATALPDLILAAPSRSPSAVEYHARAILALRAGNLRDASHFAGESFELDPRYRPAIALLAQLELRIDPRQFRSAIPRIRLLSGLAREAGDEFDRADAELELGLTDMLSGAREAALVRFDAALATFQTLGDPYGEIAALAQQVEWRLSDTAATASASTTTQPASDQPPAQIATLRAAVDHQLRILATAEQLNDALAAAPAANKLALVHERLGDYEAALKLHRRTLELAQRSGSRPNQAAAWLFIGKWHRQQEQLGEAIEALGHCIELVAPEGRPMVRSLLADMLRARGDSAAALAEYRTARNELGFDADLNAQLVCMREIAALEMSVGQPEKAIAALQEARDIAGAMRHPDLPAIDQQLTAWRAGQP